MTYHNAMTDFTPATPIDYAHEFAAAVIGFYTRNCPISESRMNRLGRVIAKSDTLSRLSELYTREAIRGQLSATSLREKANLEAIAASETITLDA